MTKKYTTAQDLGLTREVVSLAWGKVYLQPTTENGRDYHSEFAEALGCTRNQAKELCYWFIYTTPFLLSLDCLAQIGALENSRNQILSRGNANESVDAITRRIDYLESKRGAALSGRKYVN